MGKNTGLRPVVLPTLLSLFVNKKRSMYKIVSFEITDLDQPNVNMKSIPPLEGTTVTFICNADGKPEPNVSWTRNGFPLNTSENADMSISDDQKTLTIVNVRRTDSGEYRCRANNSVGNSTSYASELDVLCK